MQLLQHQYQIGTVPRQYSLCATLWERFMESGHRCFSKTLNVNKFMSASHYQGIPPSSYGTYTRLRVDQKVEVRVERSQIKDDNNFINYGLCHEIELTSIIVTALFSCVKESGK